MKNFPASVILEKLFVFFNSVTVMNKKSPVLRRRGKMFLSVLIMGVVYLRALHFMHYMCH